MTSVYCRLCYGCQLSLLLLLFSISKAQWMTIGDYCNESYECGYDAVCKRFSPTCRIGVCQCRDGFSFDSYYNFKCLPSVAHVGDTCDPSVQVCATPFSACSTNKNESNICQCLPGYSFENGNISQTFCFVLFCFIIIQTFITRRMSANTERNSLGSKM